jgi:GINS complex subunit 2
VYGPFKAATHTQVPLWLAIYLRKLQKCRIKAPDWMDLGLFAAACLLALNRCVSSLAEALESHKKREQSRELFEPIHFHFMEIAALLLTQYARLSC